jgi:hypothetical protein
MFKLKSVESPGWFKETERLVQSAVCRALIREVNAVSFEFSVEDSYGRFVVEDKKTS